MLNRTIVILWACFALFACKNETCDENRCVSRNKVYYEGSLIYHDQEWRVSGDINVAVEDSGKPETNSPALEQITLLSGKYLKTRKETLSRYQQDAITKISSSDQIMMNVKTSEEMIYIENGQVFYSYRSDTLKGLTVIK